MAEAVFSENQELANHVDNISELMAKVFDKEVTNQCMYQDDLICYKLITHVLKGLGLPAFGMNVQSFENDIRRAFEGSSLFEEIDPYTSETSELSKSLRKIIPDATYIAASYWSPRDDKRHTAQFRRGFNIKKKKAQRNALASACAFYLLTHAGRDYGLYSTTQYINEKASRKRGVWVDYKSEDGEQDQSRWWHIPPKCHKEILHKTGIDTFIKEFREMSGDNDLNNILNDALINTSDPTGHDLADSFIKKFNDESHETLSDEARNIITKSKKYAEALFGTEITFKQALFMVMTNILYNREACPADYFYAYTVHVRGTCCVMTVGTNKRFTSEEHLAISRSVSSIFTHPLFSDYAIIGNERGTYMDPVALDAINKGHYKKAQTKDATICFWDIRGFSALCNNLSREEKATEKIAQFVGDYNKNAQLIIKKHNGILDKFIGDGIMAIFGIETSNTKQDSGSINALRAAIELKVNFEQLVTKSSLLFKDLKLGCGIHTGQVMVGLYGGGERRHFTALGDPVNVAARIESLAKKGEIMASLDAVKIIKEQCKNISSWREESEKEGGQYELWEATRQLKNIDKLYHVYNVRSLPAGCDESCNCSIKSKTEVISSERY